MERITEMNTLFYPCIIDASGKVRDKVSDKPMPRIDAENFLKAHYRHLWTKCEAIPQPVNHPYFTGAKP